MTGTPHDVAAPGFEDRLWTDLARLHASGTASAGLAQPPGPVGPPAGRSVRRRARRSLLAGVGIAATAAAVMAAIAVTVPGTGDGEDAETAGPAGVETPDPGVPVETRIINATDAALADSIVHVMQDMSTGPGDSEMWSDEQSGRVRSRTLDANGAPSFDSGPAAPPAVDDVGPGMPPPGTPPFDPSLPSETHRQVDYCFGEYREFPQALLPGHNEAAGVRDGLADGSMIEDGTQVVDGRELIRVVRLLEPATGERAAALAATEAAGGPATTDTVPTGGPITTGTATEEQPVVDEDHVTLIDPETYRPVMLLGYAGSSAEYVMTFEYLPRTVENLALLSPPVPEGFVQTAASRGDGERVDHCGW